MSQKTYTSYIYLILKTSGEILFTEIDVQILFFLFPAFFLNTFSNHFNNKV